MKAKHVFRSGSSVAGFILVACALVDGRNDWLPHLDAQWLLAAGVVLIGLAARKTAVKLPQL